MNILSNYLFEKLKIKISLASRIQSMKKDKAEKYFKFIKFLQNLIYLPDIQVLIINDEEDKIPIRDVYNHDRNVKISKWWPKVRYSDSCTNNYFSQRIKYNESDLAENNKSTFVTNINKFIDEALYRYECISNSKFYLILDNIDKSDCKYFEKIGFTKYPYEEVLDYMNDSEWSYGREMYATLKPHYDKYNNQIVFISFDDLLVQIDIIYDKFYDENNDEIDEDPETIEDIKDDGELENNE